MDVTGNAAGQTPEPSAIDTEDFFRSATPADVGVNAARGVGRHWVEVMKGYGLHSLFGAAFDAYAMGRAIKEGYDEDGAVGVLRALNPYTPIVEAVNAGYELAVKGDVPGAAEVIAPAVVQAMTCARSSKRTTKRFC